MENTVAKEPLLTVSAENITLREKPIEADAHCKPGPYLLITVADTGSGIRARSCDGGQQCLAC